VVDSSAMSVWQTDFVLRAVLPLEVLFQVLNSFVGSETKSFSTSALPFEEPLARRQLIRT